MDLKKNQKTYDSLSAKEKAEVDLFIKVFKLYGNDVEFSPKKDALLVRSKRTGKVWLTQKLNKLRRIGDLRTKSSSS